MSKSSHSKVLAGVCRLVLEWLPVALVPLVLVALFYWIYFYGSGTFYLRKWQVHPAFIENRATEFASKSISSPRLDLGVYCVLSHRHGISDPGEVITSSLRRNFSGDQRAEYLKYGKSRLDQIQSLLEQFEAVPKSDSAPKSTQAVEQFTANWADSFDKMVRVNASWRELWDIATFAELEIIEKDFNLNERMRLIEAYATVTKNDVMQESKIVTAVELLALHAGILWRKPSMRDKAVRCMRKAEELRLSMDFSSLDFLAEANVALCKAYARMGDHARALVISQTLGGSRKIAAANEAMIFEINRPFSNERLNNLSLLLNTERLARVLDEPQELVDQTSEARSEP